MNTEELLAASQAREKALRGRLEYVDAYLEECDENFDNLRGDIAIELSMPTEDTALKAALAAERKKERNRIANWYDNGGWAVRDSEVSNAIRALGD